MGEAPKKHVFCGGVRQMLPDQFLVVISYHYLVVGLEKNMNLIHVIFQVSNGIYLIC